MKKKIWIFFLLLPLSAWNEENLQQLGQEAEALWEAHDYKGASTLYEQLLSYSLPHWQHMRLLYNLGTIRLAQYQTHEAIEQFQNIMPTDLSLPLFGRNLFINLGIAYWQYAQALANRTDSSLEQQALFLEQSLRAINEAQDLECEVQQSEQNEPSFSCQLPLLIDQWKRTLRLQLQTVYTEQRQQWLEQASIETLATFLQTYIQELMQRIEFFQKQNSHSSLKNSFFPYFQNQINSFVPVWKALNQKLLSPDQESIFDRAAKLYLNGMKALTHLDLAAVLKEFNQSIETLASLAFQNNISLQQARLHYDMLLLQESFTPANLQFIISQFDHLEVKESQTQLLEYIKKYLQKSLEALQNKQSIEARFFLLAGLDGVESLAKERETTSIFILQQSLRHAQRVLQLFLLAQVMPEDSNQNKQIPAILYDQQKIVLTHANSFIPAVLQEQENSFQRAGTPALSCQQSPWDQVIPLFDQGWQAAQSAVSALNQKELNSAKIIGKQQQTIQAWQQALNLLLHPPKQSPPSSSDGESQATPQNLSETFRLIQEMYLEDQSQPQKTDQELHSW